MNPRTRQATGHIDRDGRMIHRHDEVAVTRRPHYINTNYETEPARRARVLWVGRKWLLYFENGATEDLNNYGQKELKIRCDNSCDNKKRQA